jgi:hypothetical protein
MSLLIDDQIKDLTKKPFVKVRRSKTFKQTNEMPKKISNAQKKIGSYKRKIYQLG